MGIWLNQHPGHVIFPALLKLLSCSRCPYNDDHYLTKVVPVDASSGLQHPNHYKRFSFKMFAFVDKNSMNIQRDTVQFKYNLQMEFLK